LTNDPKFLSTYTHFIFDEIHERGLECDFSLIAIKLHLWKRKGAKVKIVLMSATLNSEMFSRFFAKNKMGQFVLAKIIPEKLEKKERGRGRGELQ
jgi:HrpA-like RNA helicase